ncbi:hypothetical protein LMCDFJHI_02331 [Aeromonas salmonicida]
MRLQFGQGKGAAHRLRVAHQMQVVILEIHHLATVRPHYVGLLYVPLIGHCPVETFGATGHLPDLQIRQAVLADQGQSLAHAITGQAAVEGEQQGQQAMQLLAELPLIVPVCGQIVALW